MIYNTWLEIMMLVLTVWRLSDIGRGTISDYCIILSAVDQINESKTDVILLITNLTVCMCTHVINDD